MSPYSAHRRRVRRFLAVVTLALLGMTQVPGSAAAPYENTVFRNWPEKELDVLVLIEPLSPIGASFDRAFKAWEAGIAYWSPTLASQLKVRYHWLTSATVPPGLQPDIVVVPQGFLAMSFRNSCIATAPMAVGWGSYDRVTFHEYGHCLGLGHVFHAGVEYRPSRDIMGGGDGPKCPSNLNVATLVNVFSGSRETVKMDPAAYQQAPAC